MSLISFRIDNRFAVRLGTCNTLLRVKKGLRGIVPWPATMVRDPLATVIFLTARTGLI